ncbi:MAG: cytochrome c [Myxococcaceae bacterium]|nr:cytochrome c [Myxococcaceae bacterium]
MAAIGAIAALGFHFGSAHSGHGAEHKPAVAAAPGSNAVRDEMRLLERALGGGAAHFASGDLRPIEHALHEVHAARERTTEAIRSGGYRPPRNGDQLERFLELDKDFHTQLEALAGAAARNDPKEAGAALGRVMQGCQGCHAEYR